MHTEGLFELGLISYFGRLEQRISFDLYFLSTKKL